jgi:hypothetical protein
MDIENERFNEARYGRKNEENPEWDFKFCFFILRNPTLPRGGELTIFPSFSIPRPLLRPFPH